MAPEAPPPLPRPARLLGWLGLLPAAAALAAAHLAPPREAGLAIHAGALYAGLILSFLGGAWWGLATRGPADMAWRLYGVAVIPSLAAWLLLATPMPSGIMLLGGLVIGSVLVDIGLDGRGLTPAGWLALRLPLSVGLGVLTILLGLAARAPA